MIQDIATMDPSVSASLESNFDINDFIVDPADPFGFYNDNVEFREFYNQALQETIETTTETDTFTMCCGQEMNPANDGYIICSICNASKAIHGDITIDHAKSTGVHFIIAGKHSHLYKRLLHPSDKQNYIRLRMAYITIIIERMNISNPTDKQLPQEILRDAIELCVSIMEIQTFRTNVLRQLIAACIDQACIKRNMQKRCKDIANFVGLSTNGFSSGTAILIYMNRTHNIKIIEHSDPTDSLINSIFSQFPQLHSPKEPKDCKKYKSFIHDILRVVRDKHIIMNANPYSRIVGAVYLLIEAFKLNISIDELVKKCNIALLTINRVISLIKSTFREFVGIYNKYRVDFPANINVNIITRKRFEITPPVILNNSNLCLNKG